ncbi:Uncharacterised protein [uncultured archaeon]|nr:Uncharacterised protein [uncultured archaeon]
MECEVCGEGEAMYLAMIEGAKLNVCAACAGSGRIVKPLFAPQPSAAAAGRLKEEMEVVEGYGSLIAGARKKLGLPIEVLAERINEKLSFLERVEHEKTLPDEKVVHKLEKELGIKLLQPASESAAPSTSRSGAGMTLGDILEIQKKEKKK